MPRDNDNIHQDLIAELAAARQRIAELEARETDYLLSAQKIREREAWGNSLLDSLHAGVLLVDPETHRIVDANTFATKMIGRPKEELIGHICHAYVCLAAKGNCPFTDRGQQVEPREDLLLRSDGTTVPIHKTVTTVTHHGKKLLLESFVDISEQKKAQRALELDEIRFEALYNLSQIINEPEQYILDYALEACIRVSDSTFGYIFFVSDDETELTVHAWSQGAMEQCAIQDPQTVFKVSETGLWGDAIRQRRPVITNDYEACSFKRGVPEGHVPLTRHMNLPVKDDGKMVLLAGVGNKEQEYTDEDVKQLYLIMDGLWRIIQRKRDETALKMALSDAKQVGAKIEVILKSVADGLIFTDMENRIQLMSSSAEIMLGTQLDSVFSLPIVEAVEIKELAEQLVAIQLAAKEEITIDLELPGDNDGEVRIIQAKPAIVRDRDGKEVGVITLLRDVSRERELDRMKREFIATAAHELRTPLTAVMGFSELLLCKKDIDEGQRSEFLSVIHKKAEILGKIVGDLLDLSRVDSGRLIRLKKDWADIGSIIGRSTTDYQRACPEHQFKAILPEMPLMVFLDDRKLFQVMENLLGNAVKFSPPGGVIRVVCEVSAADLRISVSDEGVGMTPEQVDRVFDKFYRVDASNTAKEGLGLGMAIVKNIVEAHGCQIWVDSEVGKGTKVTFTLPGRGLGSDLDGLLANDDWPPIGQEVIPAERRFLIDSGAS
jgi:PAS domain S-box-containing protein